MAKRQIRIREALADVRSGMTDTELMEKYQLAAKGLQSLFAKLVHAQLISMEELEQRMPGFMQSASLSNDSSQSTDRDGWKIRLRKPGEPVGQAVSAREAIADIRGGGSDAELMEKYKLSSKGLQDLFDQLVEAQLISRQELDQRMPTMDSTVDLKDLVEGLDLEHMLEEFDQSVEEPWTCSSCGESYEIDMEKCPSCGHRRADKSIHKSPAPQTRQDMPSQAEVPRDVPQPDRQTTPPLSARVQLKDVVRDVRAGLTDAELMAKYKASYRELDEVFTRLLEDQLLTRGEIYGRSSFFSETATIETVSESSSHYLAFPIPISDAIDPKIMGRLRTVGETEIGTVGIAAQVDEIRSFVVFPEKFVDIEPFTFDAKCQWYTRQPEGHYAGFEITFIKERDLSRLKKMIKALTFGD